MCWIFMRKTDYLFVSYIIHPHQVAIVFEIFPHWTPNDFIDNMYIQNIGFNFLIP